MFFLPCLKPNITPQLETSALGDLVQISHLLEQCHALGVSVALDDFGTGYSSLTYLKRLPAAVIKVDQSFVRDIIDDPEDLAILDGILGLADAFGRKVIAEGMETEAHGDLLLRIGCELAQGFGIARPMPAAQIPEWVQSWRPPPHWPAMRRIGREALPLLYAGVEHRSWVQELVTALRVGGEWPTLDPNRCRFGYWLDNTTYHAQPGFAAIEQTHLQIHHLAGELRAQRERGEAAQALARLEELYALRDSLLAQLESYLN